MWYFKVLCLLSLIFVIVDQTYGGHEHSHQHFKLEKGHYHYKYKWNIHNHGHAKVSLSNDRVRPNTVLPD